MGKCKDCQFWKSGGNTGLFLRGYYGTCQSGKLWEVPANEDTRETDIIMLTYDKVPHESHIWTGVNFGCIHFQGDKKIG